MIYTTLNKIKAHHPCGTKKNSTTGLRKLLNHLGKTKCDDEPLGFDVILESNGLDNALWCTRSSPYFYMVLRTFALWCARQCEYLNNDIRVKSCNDVTERFLHGEATQEELNAAWAAAGAAWSAAGAAGAAGAAAWAAAMDAQKTEFLRLITSAYNHD